VSTSTSSHSPNRIDVELLVPSRPRMAPEIEVEEEVSWAGVADATSSPHASSPRYSMS
jgi:hypothetical protein